MRLADGAWTDARDLETDLALLPVGSTEQHGPHAPLGTDTLAATAVADAAADRYEAAVAVAPPVPVGVAEEHRHFDGTLWVGEDTLRAYVGDVIRSLASHGFDRVVVANGHGGNVAPLREVCGRLTRDGTAYAVSFTWFEAVDPDRPLGHGGPVETSLVRHVAPELIREDRFAAAREGGADGFGQWVAGTNLAYDFREFSDAGNVGDPTDASDAAGAALLDAAAERLCEVLDAVATRDGAGASGR